MRFFFLLYFFFISSKKRKERRSRLKRKQHMRECMAGGVTGEGSIIIQAIFASFFFLQRKIETTEFYSFIQFCCCALLSHSFNLLRTRLLSTSSVYVCISFENIDDKYMCKKHCEGQIIQHQYSQQNEQQQQPAISNNNNQQWPRQIRNIFLLFFLFLHFFFFIVAWPPLLFVNFTTT